MAKTDAQITAGEAVKGAAGGGIMGAAYGAATGALVGALGAVSNLIGAGAALAIGLVSFYIGGASLPAAVGLGLGIPAGFGALGGALMGLTLGGGIGLGFGGISGALSGAERAAERADQLDIVKAQVKGKRADEIATAQAATIDQVGPQLYMQGRMEERAALMNQMALAHAEAGVGDKKFVGRCCPTEPRTHQQVVQDTLAAANQPPVPGA